MVVCILCFMLLCKVKTNDKDSCKKIIKVFLKQMTLPATTQSSMAALRHGTVFHTAAYPLGGCSVPGRLMNLQKIKLLNCHQIGKI